MLRMASPLAWPAFACLFDLPWSLSMCALAPPAAAIAASSPHRSYGALTNALNSVLTAHFQQSPGTPISYR